MDPRAGRADAIQPVFGGSPVELADEPSSLTEGVVAPALSHGDDANIVEVRVRLLDRLETAPLSEVADASRSLPLG
jgi:hypothetical protein